MPKGSQGICNKALQHTDSVTGIPLPIAWRRCLRLGPRRGQSKWRIAVAAKKVQLLRAAQQRRHFARAQEGLRQQVLTLQRNEKGADIVVKAAAAVRTEMLTGYSKRVRSK